MRVNVTHDMKKFFKIFLWIVVGIIFIGTFYFLYRNSMSKPEVYAQVRPGFRDVEKSTVLTGKIEPRDEIEIKPQISGIITEILVEPGEQVQAGDVIARIQVVPEASSLSSAQNRLNVATIELENARTRFGRDSVLYSRRVISREEYETSLRDLRRAAEELDGARDALEIVRDGVSRYNASESNTMVRATITGLVLDVPVKVGSSVIQSNTFNDGTTIATVADMNNLIFRGKVDETEVGLLRVGMPMEISIGARPELAPTAVIEYIAPKGTDSGGANTFEIKAALDVSSAENLRAGYSANATVALASATGALTVPESVVEFLGDSAFVYVLADSMATPALYNRTAIETGLSDGINIVVTSGIDSTTVVRGELIKD